MSPGAGPRRVQVVEVGPRDGFQREAVFVPTDLKVEVIDLLGRAGVGKIEATSFVHPEVIPQLRDAAEVLARVERRPGVRLTALVPNLRGLERALAAAVDAARLVVCVTETYNRRNVGMPVAASVAACRAMAATAAAAGLPLEVILGVAFGCPFEGEVAEDRVLDLARTFAAMGIREIGVADTVGLADPHKVRKLLERLRLELPGVALSIHLHDTRGLGLANAAAALDVGIDTLDASIGGLGGCPVAPDAAGNIATEDLVHLCHERGFETGIDLGLLRQASRRIESFLGRSLTTRLTANPNPSAARR